MDDIKNRIEAILFTTGSFMDVEEIARLCSIGSIGFVKDALEALIADYNTRNGALQIVEENGKFKLNIKKEYAHLTAKLLSDTELDRPTQETLAIIAYKQPILQCDVIKIRGNKAYDHIHLLKEREFIISEKHGRTRSLKVSSKFYDYFDTALETLKPQFEAVEHKVGVVEDLKAKREAEQAKKKRKTPEEYEDGSGTQKIEESVEAEEEQNRDEPVAEEKAKAEISHGIPEKEQKIEENAEETDAPEKSEYKVVEKPKEAKKEIPEEAMDL